MTGQEKTGTFLVAAVDDETAVLRDVTDAQIHTIADPCDLVIGAVIEATIRSEPPLEVVWSLAEVDARRSIPVERSPESPTKLAEELAADQAVGEVTTRERAGEGELHVLSVPSDRTDDAAADVLEDEETVARAARIGVDRVKVRAAAGVVSVRYLP